MPDLNSARYLDDTYDDVTTLDEWYRRNIIHTVCGARGTTAADAAKLLDVLGIDPTERLR